MLHADQEFCAAILPDVSRTFAASINLLPATLRDAVRCGYLLCRVVDTVEDSVTLTYEERVSLFSAFDDVLLNDSCSIDVFSRLSSLFRQEKSSDVVLCQSADRVFRVFRGLPETQRDALRTPILTMSQGMRSYCRRQHEEGRLSIRDIVDLETYCYYVAGTVGEMLTDLFLGECPLDDDALTTVMERRIRFGLGLQFVNIVKDIADDAARGISFIPLQVLQEYGLIPSDMLTDKHRTVALQVVNKLTSIARGHLDAAAVYTKAWPVDSGSAIRLFLVVPLVLAYRSLALVEHGGEDVLRLGRNPKVPRGTVHEILAAAPAAARCNDVLDRLLAGD